MEYPEAFVRQTLFIRIGKGDTEQVEECLGWARSDFVRRRLVNSTSKSGTPAIVRAVRGNLIDAGVVAALLKHGADATAAGNDGLTALDHVNRRLLKYEGRPRRAPRRSRSLTPGNELILSKFDNSMLKMLERTAAPEEHIEIYIQERRRAAERVFDPRTQLEKIHDLLTRKSSNH